MQRGVTLIGPVSNDIVQVPGHPKRQQPGGAVFYAGMALCALGVPVNIITRLAPHDAPALLTPLRNAGATIIALPSAHTTSFINSYGPDTDERTQEVSACAAPFTIEDMQFISTQWVYFGPLLCGDIASELIRHVADRSAHHIALDAQGLLRRATDRKVLPIEWPDNNEILPRIDILKADAEEAALLTAQRDPEMAARILCGRGADHALVTLGDGGAIMCHRGALIRQRACRPANQNWPVVDTTGCGDTFLAAYLACIIMGKQAAYAGRFAVAAAALKLTSFGPLCADMAQISRLAENCPDFFDHHVKT
ncbi:MAG: PfkB family carbohydrate kinase [Alphaproteobacteria bacterium]